jgi:hypothetical protein
MAPMKWEDSAQTAPLSGNFDALAPSGAAKFPSIRWSRGTRAPTGAGEPIGARSERHAAHGLRRIWVEKTAADTVARGRSHARAGAGLEHLLITLPPEGVGALARPGVRRTEARLARGQSCSAEIEPAITGVGRQHGGWSPPTAPRVVRRHSSFGHGRAGPVAALPRPIPRGSSATAEHDDQRRHPRNAPRTLLPNIDRHGSWRFSRGATLLQRVQRLPQRAKSRPQGLRETRGNDGIRRPGHGFQRSEPENASNPIPERYTLSKPNGDGRRVSFLRFGPQGLGINQEGDG